MLSQSKSLDSLIVQSNSYSKLYFTFLASSDNNMNKYLQGFATHESKFA